MQRLKSSKKRIIGFKQTVKAINNDKVDIVYLADDADDNIKNSILEACRGKNIEIVHVETMKELGDACGIDVNASCASLLKS